MIWSIKIMYKSTNFFIFYYNICKIAFSTFSKYNRLFYHSISRIFKFHLVSPIYNFKICAYWLVLSINTLFTSFTKSFVFSSKMFTKIRISKHSYVLVYHDFFLSLQHCLGEISDDILRFWCHFRSPWTSIIGNDLPAQKNIAEI